MRQSHCTITPSVVRRYARDLLARVLSWRDYGQRVSAVILLDVLLLAAALGSSLFAVVKRFAFGFSHETARQALQANLPDILELTDGLVDALYFVGSRTLRRRAWVVAIDTHFDPYYGDHDDPGVIGGKKKQGTKYFHGYATACLVHHRHRYTVGLLALSGGEKPHQIVETLLDQMSSRGLKLRAVVLDAGFSSGDVLLLLQERDLSYTVPLQRCGKGSNRRNACWDLPMGSLTTVEWKTDKGSRPVSTEAMVLQQRGNKEKRVYAFRGWGAAEAAGATQRARLARRWYRKRFGIETGYRQMRQGKARTASKDPVYRLLLVGLGLLMRQVWVWLTWQIAQDRSLRPTAWVSELPLRLVWEWIADFIKRNYKEVKEIPLGTPLPHFHDARP